MNNSRPSFTLNSNKSVGFKNAVTNGQTRLALEYAEQIISELCDRVNLLESVSVEEGDATLPKATAEAVAEEKKVVRVKKTSEEV